jgi:ADP-heptose:LPS heptosyltransferase
MKSSFYRKRWANTKAQDADPKEVKRLARQIAHSFMDAYLKNCHYEEDYIDLLCEMTTQSQISGLNSISAQALFRIIIEKLCDDFEELQTETYNNVMTQIISYCRRIPAGKDLDRCLNGFKIYSRNDLLERIKRTRLDAKMLSRQMHIKKIILLSRVTIGADVAVTSIIIQRLAELFPEAQFVLIGGSNLDEIYGGNSRIRLRAVFYDRQGGLLERLSSWQMVLNTIQKELATCPLEKTVLIDPDSRLSQLGVLPIIDPDHYFFFDSRSDVSFAGNMSMAQLANTWLDKITGEQNFRYPRVWLLAPNIQKAVRLNEKLKKNGAQRIIAINFGVGGNPRKKVGQLLEQELLLSLLKEPNTVILLDKGIGDKELQSSHCLLDYIKEQGYPVEEAVFAAGFESKIRHGIIGLQTGIGEIAAIIAECDEYIGYDSACQHIAAASETPCLTIFAGSNNMRFIRRWSAFGPNICQIVHVDTLTDPTTIVVQDIITRIMNERRNLKNSA